MSALGTIPYTDATGRTWLVAKLDRLLDDPAVRRKAEETLRASTNRAGRFNPGAAFTKACRQYKRDECGALLHMLVVRLRDREDEHEHA
ncbi:hypothetical protein [Methylobacterium sp. J-068]|jgi:hypothetical protein|uniref:hypothetical protein n=1 Tax=Methylobacterium sp. J-068 TaxID=2836649 RepID=UPI001FBC0B0D|nr:hypothetical protein [Methylobacterium sp. J-068]MCJ2032617.1 hypothetical protein [Methylobacterium sp. J-068]MCJ2032954.1 hypothetical protein [Methylobacterium sp. J-068]